MSIISKVQLLSLRTGRRAMIPPSHLMRLEQASPRPSLGRCDQTIGMTPVRLRIIADMIELGLCDVWPARYRPVGSG